MDGTVAPIHATQDIPPPPARHTRQVFIVGCITGIFKKYIIKIFASIV
jgi:hypothetical protein